MIKFSLTAPGKVILFGEHSVVYGKTAIAASIGLRTRLNFQETEHDFIEINFENINLHYEIQIKDVDNLIELLNACIDDISPQMPNHDKFLQLIVEYLENHCKLQKLTNIQKPALISFVYLLTGIRSYKKYKSSSGFNIYVDSTLRVGAGLGSSASFSVVLAGCFLQEIIFRQLNSPDMIQFNAEQLSEISQWAYCSERIMHGTPSGLDNSICTYGSIVRFRRNEELAVLQLDNSFEALLVDTLVPRQTKVMVGNVRTLVENHPILANCVLDAMDQVAKDAEKILTSKYDPDNCKKLKELIKINQGLLQTIGVSHSSINTICQIAEDKNVAAKLTGAGGGGFCIVVPIDSDPAKLTELTRALENSGFPTKRILLGGPGLRIE